MYNNQIKHSVTLTCISFLELGFVARTTLDSKVYVVE